MRGRCWLSLPICICTLLLAGARAVDAVELAFSTFAGTPSPTSVVNEEWRFFRVAPGLDLLVTLESITAGTVTMSVVGDDMLVVVSGNASSSPRAYFNARFVRTETTTAVVTTFDFVVRDLDDVVSDSFHEKLTMYALTSYDFVDHPDPSALQSYVVTGGRSFRAVGNGDTNLNDQRAWLRVYYGSSTSTFDFEWGFFGTPGVGTHNRGCFFDGNVDFWPGGCATGVQHPFVAKWGARGSAPGELDRPAGLAVDASGLLYVADSGNHRIQKFSAGGVGLEAWGVFGSGDAQFKNPMGVAVDDAGNVYVVDQGNERIQKLSSSGGYLAQWGTVGSANGEFRGPTAIAVHGGKVYVVDRGNNRVQRFNTSGTYEVQWGGFGPGDGQFNGPTGIAADQVGNIYVTDLNQTRIQRFNTTGGFLAKWGSYGDWDGAMENPVSIATDLSGEIFVVDQGNRRIQRFTNTGGYQAAWGVPGSGNGEFGQPFGVATNAAGDVFVSDLCDHSIQVFQGCYVDAVAVEDQELPKSPFIRSLPNPFVATTEVEFTLASSKDVQIRVHDVTGRLVRRLVGGRLEAGRHRVSWDGLDENRIACADGVYFIRVDGSGVKLKTKVSLLR